MTEEIYTPAFVAQLFNEMAATYGAVNYISSFGFCQRWRELCVRHAQVAPGMQVFDLMTGMGECWQMINRVLEDQGRLVAVDLSPEMCRRAHARKTDFAALPIEVRQEDILSNTIADQAADCVISSFGLKTFSPSQLDVLAHEVNRILKPSGRFSFLEISVPPNPILRLPYLFYLRYCIPLLGRLFLGNPHNYRMLGIYTEKFNDCSFMGKALQQQGLYVEQHQDFFGCATLVCGYKLTT